MIKLNIDELQNMFDLFCANNFVTQSTIKNSWINFQHRATTVGVTQYEIDEIILTDDEFGEKYTPKDV